MTWFRCPEPRPFAAVRLFCLPHAGGSAVAFRSWPKEISPAVEVHAVQYPGRADRLRDPLVPDAGRLARLVAGAMGPLLDRPAALFGHSMGALVAFEVARLLQERGTPVAHLFVSGTRPPHDRDDESISGLDDDGLIGAMTRLGGTDAEILRDPEMRELVLPYVRNDFRLVEDYRYVPGPALTSPVTALVGDADHRVDEPSAARWGELTSAPFALRVLPGGHFYLVPEQSAVLAEIHRGLNIEP
ncbi:alpha/beta fold hydrolase [Actinomadura rayongensis]|uniref:Alpha/beta fold hydrolase n=1 Tax=Actinomadura rayongensis TaxID=1429076 RepID=A0A6I4WHQ7_9ACTN|nr:alpha/beta fold hydrolase [Actinomadura rayongensis]